MSTEKKVRTKAPSAGRRVPARARRPAVGETVPSSPALARKPADEALRQSEATFRALAENALVGIYILQDGRFAYVNPAMARVFGYSVAEMTGLTLREIVQPSELDMVDENIRRRITGEVGALGYEVKGRRKDGSIRDVEVYGTRVEMNGRLALIGTLVDLTERKQADLALAESERRYRMLFESAPAGILLIGPDGRVRAANSLQARLYGYGSTRELEGLYAPSFVAEKDRDRVSRTLTGRSAGDDWPARTYTCVRRDGSEFLGEVTSIVLQGEAEDVQGYLWMTRDITREKQGESERIELRYELAHLTRVMAMNELSTSLAHEINQPLGSILNNAQAARSLLRRAEDPGELGEIIGDIIQDVQRAGDVVRKIRGAVKKSEARFEPLSVNTLIEDVLKLVINSLAMNGVTLHLDLKPDLADVRGDRVRLQQVLLNLMTNAIEAMKGVSLRVLDVRSAAPAADTVVVSVCDTGPGLDQAGQADAFKPFFTTKKDGLGMGLTICRSIIEEHGGRIWAENGAAGGAAFHFALKAGPGSPAPGPGREDLERRRFARPARPLRKT